MHARDIDDLALAAGRSAPAYELLRAEEVAIEVGFELVLPVLNQHIDDLLAGGVDACIVDKNQNLSR